MRRGREEAGQPSNLFTHHWPAGEILSPDRLAAVPAGSSVQETSRNGPALVKGDHIAHPSELSEASTASGRWPEISRHNGRSLAPMAADKFFGASERAAVAWVGSREKAATCARRCAWIAGSLPRIRAREHRLRSGQARTPQQRRRRHRVHCHLGAASTEGR